MKQAQSPIKLTGCKYIGKNKKGNLIFKTDDGLWSAEPDQLIDISGDDLYITGIIRRVASTKKKYRYQYKWINDIEEEPVKQASQPIQHDALGKGLTVGKSIAKKIFRVGV
jgi:hypothetical protein